MKKIDIKKYDEEKIELLKRIMGWEGPEAKLLLCLTEEGTSALALRDIERTADLRQGEVSRAARQLEKDGLITIGLRRRKRGQGPGRSQHICTALPKDKLLAVIKERALVRIKKALKDMKQLEQVF